MLKRGLPASQLYHPEQFWTQRNVIAEEMERALKTALMEQGHADVFGVQLLQIAFLEKYEDTIVKIQLATQQRTTQEFQQQVRLVLISNFTVVQRSLATIVVEILSVVFCSRGPLFR